jgi:hypothetical protein
MADPSNREEWKKIAEQITQETDFEKLMQLVRQLCDACDRQQGNVRSEEQFPAA